MTGMRQWLRVGVVAVIAVGGSCTWILRAHPQNAPAPATPSTGATTAPSTLESGEHTLLFTGDIMLSRAVGARMAALGDWSLPFHLIADTLRDADLRYCNLECPVSDRGHNLHHLYSFRADPRVLDGLKAAGFNVASQANNHTYDWGPEALLDSLERLRAAGIQPVGAGQNFLAAHYPLLVNVGGVRIAFLAYVNIDPKEATAGADRPGVAWLDPTQVVADIRFARPLADLVIVCPHWGVEYALQPTREQVEIAHQMIDAGADLVVGSHPHVVEPLEKVPRSLDRLQPWQLHFRPAELCHPPRPDVAGQGAREADRRSSSHPHQNQLHLSGRTCSARPTHASTDSGRPRFRLICWARVGGIREKRSEPFRPAGPSLYRVPTFSSSAPVVAATSACSEFPCESMVTIAGKLRASKTHIASGTPSSSKRNTSRTLGRHRA